MKNKRREFLKLAGLTGLGLAGTGFIPKHVVIESSHKGIPDWKLAAKYGLELPGLDVDNGPAPVWLQRADMFTMDRWFTGIDTNKKSTIWKGYDIGFNENLIERIMRLAYDYGLKRVNERTQMVKEGAFDGSSIKGVTLISHAPVSKMASEQAHRQEFKIIPYLHFTDVHTYYADQDVFVFQHPEVLIKNENGHWVHQYMDGTDRLYRLLTCANNPVYWKLSLAYVKKVMEMGMDGIFIDNVSPGRQPCFAPKFNTKHNPEFNSYTHEHLFPDATQDEAFNRFLQTIRKIVKGYGDDKIMVLNSGIGSDLQKNGDCCMWESFIYSWSWKGRNPAHSWTAIKKRADDNAWYYKMGRRITVLSYLDTSGKEVKDDAFWAFSTARLVGFIWWALLEGTGAEILYRVHLGEPLGPLQELKGIAFKTYKNGLIALNDNTTDQDVELSLSENFKPQHLLDIYNELNSMIVSPNDSKVKVSIPGKSARIFISPDVLK